jgi:hypothetical protein
MIRTVENALQLARLIADLKDVSFPFTLVIGKDRKRTNAMNRTIHRWFGEIAAQKGDMTLAEVKADCNLTYGVPIKLREDPEWSAAFSYIFDALNRPSKCKALRVLDIPVTRNMTVPQLCEYMDQMFRDYRAEGFYLTDPELQKYQEVA